MTRLIGKQPCITFVTLGQLTQWAELRRWGPPRPVNDTWVAACALTYGLPLATLNAKHFKDFANHDGLNLIIQTR